MKNYLFSNLLPPGASKVDQTVKFERTVQDLKNHQICEFGQLQRLMEGEQCTIGSLSWRYKLFKISFLTTFISMKTVFLGSNLVSMRVRIILIAEAALLYQAATD